MSEQPVPGWYPDPQDGQGGRRRWWDGSRWTEHTQEDAAPGPVAQAVPDSEARTWAMVAHLSALVGAWFALAFLGPLLVYVLKKDEHPYIRRQAAEALNFNLSVLLYAVVFGIVFLITILLIVGVILIPVAIAGAVAWLVLVIVAAVRANRGEPYRYPLTIRFID